MNVNGKTIPYFKVTQIKSGEKGMTTLTCVGRLQNDSDENEAEITLLAEGILSIISFELSVDPNPKIVIPKLQWWNNTD